VLASAAGPVKNQQTRFVAVRCRMLSDEFHRQVIIELGGLHVLSLAKVRPEFT
jgi:hypothetical protein